MDKNLETFIIHVLVLNVAEPSIYPSQVAQLAALQYDKTFTKIPAENSDYVDVFSSDLAIELPKNTGINKYAIELIEGKQLPYVPIYTLSPMELETLKAYIKTHLKTGFIQPSNSPAGASILFDKKPDGTLRLCVYYLGFKNLTNKNRYLLPLNDKSLDRLGQAKRFTQLDLTSAYHQMRIREGDKWKTALRTRYGHFEY